MTSSFKKISSLISVLSIILFISFFYKNYKNTSHAPSEEETKSSSSILINKKSPENFVKSYPDFIIGFKDNNIIWHDGTKMIYDDGVRIKSFSQLLEKPDLEDQLFSMIYPRDSIFKTPLKNQDPGRVRFEPFFLKMYGASIKEVKSNLVKIVWLPKHVNRIIEITRINNIDKKLIGISKELDEHPEIIKYLSNPGGTFLWRIIKGTNRISTHSFGITIDINVAYSDYWQWDNKDWRKFGENIDLVYKNRIPQLIVNIFRKYGFIWGGNWYHYDTMHFEYRPELLI